MKSATDSDHADGGKAPSGPLAPARLSTEFLVGRTPTADEMEALARAGFRSIINNRPDGEKGSPLTSSAMQARAAALGLAYRHLPVEGRNPREEDVGRFAQALAELPRPIYACCHSGGRSAALWALASAADMPTDEIIRTCAAAGFDLRWLEPKIDMRKEMIEERQGDEGR